jgi:hypothetical protein
MRMIRGQVADISKLVGWSVGSTRLVTAVKGTLTLELGYARNGYQYLEVDKRGNSLSGVHCVHVSTSTGTKASKVHI